MPYSFRHRYSATGHGRGLQPKQMADAMGHSLEVHMGNYARFMTRDLASAFDAANALAAAAVPIDGLKPVKQDRQGRRPETIAAQPISRH